MVCHKDVRDQVDTHGPMHGLLANAQQCRACHTEHKGAHAPITDMRQFDHDHAAFQLTGKHRVLECQSCHVNNVFKGTAQTCVSCHQEPVTHKGRFGTQCVSCHSTETWKDVALSVSRLGDFNHDTTNFKLTGRHKSTNCQACHANQTFKGTSTTCVSCHAEPPTPQVHHFRYGNACAGCHDTTTFSKPTFTHTAFSMTHGSRKNTCATCHTDEEHFEKYTCYNCHEHRKDRIERIHSRRNVANLDACVDCHGRRSRRTDLGTEGLPICAACDVRGDGVSADFTEARRLLAMPRAGTLPVAAQAPTSPDLRAP
jgi:hypothetical protein